MLSTRDVFKSFTKEISMRPVVILRLVLLATLLLTFGCSSNNKGKIEGTKWSSQATTVKGQSFPAGAFQLEFGSDNRLAYRAGPVTLTGTYSLGSGNNVTFNLDQELGGRKTHVEKISISGDTLTMTDSDGTEVTFTKVK
jgi:hypothetical protein